MQSERKRNRETKKYLLKSLNPTFSHSVSRPSYWYSSSLLQSLNGGVFVFEAVKSCHRQRNRHATKRSKNKITKRKTGKNSATEQPKKTLSTSINILAFCNIALPHYVTFVACMQMLHQMLHAASNNNYNKIFLIGF